MGTRFFGGASGPKRVYTLGMRLGVLSFGSTLSVAESLEPLRAQDVDVVVGEAGVTTATGAKAEAERIARADADAVLLHVGADARADLVAHAAQFLGVPLLVAGLPVPALFDACGALAETGSRFDRHILTENGDGEKILVWLQEHTRKTRQAGIDAALKVYGQTLHVETALTTSVDAARWRQQFGVRIVTGPLADGDAADFTAPDGDASAALCGHLLHLISKQDVTTHTYGDVLPPDATFAQIARRAGKYQILCVHPGATWPDLHPHLLSGKILGTTGNYLSALQAACEVWDVDAVFVP